MSLYGALLSVFLYSAPSLSGNLLDFAAFANLQRRATLSRPMIVISGHSLKLRRSFLQIAMAMIQDTVGITDFHVDPTDDLWKTVELDQGNVEYRLEQYLGETGKQFPMLYDDQGLRLENVGDLVRLLHARVVEISRS